MSKERDELNDPNDPLGKRIKAFHKELRETAEASVDDLYTLVVRLKLGNPRLLKIERKVLAEASMLIAEHIARLILNHDLMIDMRESLVILYHKQREEIRLQKETIKLLNRLLDQFKPGWRNLDDY